ncbi:MAG: GIY-YIG nuclease family protein [Hyphomonas sp.]|nr:GIY-YIG nuclease family protein [Hyphomonas sp.]
MNYNDRGPGWDKRAVNGIAKSHYGGLEAMFDAHGWQTGEKAYGQIAPTRVVQSYGSVEKFVEAHPQLQVMSPRAAIQSPPPNVWLTSFYGFNPETWGFLGFSNDGQRKRFVRETEPGALVVIYGHKSKAPEHQRGMVIGVQQVTHSVNHAKAYMSPGEWLRKEADSETAGKWDLAVKAIRAWRVAPEHYIPIGAFAPKTYSTERAQAIGSQGMRLAPDEARKIFDLTLIETTVFGEIPIDGAVAASGSDLLAPSKPGPVSQSGFFCKEAEGPKSLYILELLGNPNAFLGTDAGGKRIVKVGISKSPISRCDSLNRALPECAFNWRVHTSNEMLGLDQFTSSKPALRAETAIKEFFHRQEKSLGGEFFLIDINTVEQAWSVAMEAAHL